MVAEVRVIPCLKDNYAVRLHDPSTDATALVDAPDAAPIKEALQAAGWRLSDLLVTHHHGDHTAGIAELKKQFNCRVFAPRKEAAKIPGVDVTLREADLVTIGTMVGKVLETPGHTNGHIAYWFKQEKLAFVGDTLFSVGCGRVIEGTAEMMWQSLLKLRALPDDTRIYCGHEYTKANIRFAKTVEPGNAALKARETEVEKLLATGQPTIPSTMRAEKAANPFLRADLADVASSVGLAGSPAWKVFAEIRERKNRS